MFKKVSVFVLIFMLISQSILSGMGELKASASDNDRVSITDVSMIDEKGQVMDSYSNPDYEAKQSMQFSLEYNWHIENESLNNQRQFIFNVPNEILIANEQNGELLSSSQEVIGTFKATTDGQVVFTIADADEAENLIDESGTISLKASFSASSQQELDSLLVPFDLNGNEKVIQINFSKQPDDSIELEEDGNTKSISDLKTEEVQGNSEENVKQELVEEEELIKNDSEKEVVIEEGKEIQEEKIGEEAVQEESKVGQEEVITTQSKAFSAAEIKENILTDFNLTQRDGSPLPSPLPNPIENEVELKVSYSFALPNDHSYVAGSTYTFDLPKQIKMFNEVNGELDKYGTYKASTDGKVVFKFNENIELYSDISGWVDFYALIDRELEGDTTQTIVVPIQGDTTKEVVLKFSPKQGNSISKKGTPNQRYNASTIQWEIDFNKDQRFLEAAVLSDPITDKNQEFVEGSVKIYKLDVDLNGNVTQGEQVIEVPNNAFPIDFGTIDEEAYRVVFGTAIVDEETTKYTNKATLTSNKESLDATASVGISRGKALEKKSTEYDSKEQIISWEIKYNYNEKSFLENEAILTDAFGENQKLISDSVQVTEVTVNPETGAEVGKGVSFTNFNLIDKGLEGFQLQFKQDINKAYKISYKTKANNRVYENSTVTNKVSANGNETTADRKVTQQVFQKSHTGPTDYQEKKTQWKVVFNSDSHLMKNVMLQDTLPKGLTLTSHKITHGGTTLEASKDYVFTYDIQTGEISIDFKGLDPITKEVVIQYGTSFDYNSIGENKNYTNQAKLSWIPENETNKREEERKSTFTPNGQTQLNGSKSGSYNAKTKAITWTIGVNYNYREIQEAIVEDYIQGNQKFDLEALEVYKMNLQPDGSWTKGEKLSVDQYSVESITSNQLPGFRLNLGSINSPYIVEFTTSLEGELITTSYNNEATLKDGSSNFPLQAQVSVSNGGTYTSKEAVQSSQNEEIMNWRVQINATQSTIEKAKVIDKPSSNQLMLKDSMILYGTTVSENGSFVKNTEDVLKEGVDYTVSFQKAENDQEYFELAFAKTIERPYILEYNTFLMAGHGEKVSNDALLKGENITTEKTNSKKEHVVRYSAGDGGASGKLGKLTLTKIDATTKEPILGVEFTLFDKKGEIELYKGETDAKGILSFANLRFGEYVLKETKVPAGYVSFYENGKTVTINQEVNKPEDKGNEVQILNYPIINAVKLIKTDKEDSGITLQGAIFDLQKQDGKEFITVKENLKTNDKGLVYLEDLDPGTYQFVESSAPEGYLLNKEPHSFVMKKDSFEVVEVSAKNQAIDVIEISGKKVWKDNNAPNRPDSITVDLLQNNKLIKTMKVSSENNWQYSFNDLLKTNTLGVDYQYTVKEHQVNGYKTSINGFDITNLRSEKTAVEGTKTWLDDDSTERPESIVVKLLQNGKVIDSQKVSLETGWSYHFADLEKYDQEGKLYDYSVQEEGVVGYKTTVNGYDLMNLRVGTTAIEGTKTWLDNDAKERPAAIQINLLQNGEVIQTQEVTAESNWNYRFAELEEFDLKGKRYEYSVEEEPVKGYVAQIEGYDITNLRVGKTIIEGTKTWKDDNKKDRPAAIQVNLLQNGTVIETKEVTEETDWKYTFANLEKFDEKGVSYNYAVKEQGVPGYKSEVTNNDITNTRSEKTSIELTKGWLDNDSAERPSSVTMMLYQNEEVFETVSLTAKENWTYQFTDMEVFDENGQAYVYTVQEAPVDGYKSIINGYDVTNLRVGKTVVEGTKTWLDDDSEDRPESIMVKLLQNGKVIESKEVSEETDWTYAFTNLEKYDFQGKAFEYSIEENPVKGFETIINNFNITNLRTGTTVAEGTKTWLDDDSEDRPESIVVKLLQNGKVIESKEVSEETEWTYQFTDLEKYDLQGKAFEYSIEENSVKGYKTIINNFDITNLRTGMTVVEGTKTWLDDDSEDRPESIVVKLLQNGDIIKSEMVSKETDWTYAFTDLEKYDEFGKLYEYTIEEEYVEGYKSTVSEFNVTNLRVAETSVQGTKTWEDSNYSKRPETITVNLLRNNKVIDSQEVSSKTKWQYSFTGLDKYDLQGKDFDYTVEELSVEGYQSSVEGYNITNTLIYGKVELVKIDREDSSRKLKGAVFQMKDSEGSIVEEKLTTDDEGEFIVDQLQPGTYQLVEVEAPVGYQLDSTPISFTIELGQGKVLQVIAENSKIIEEDPTDPTDPTDPNSENPSSNSGQQLDNKPDELKEDGSRLPNTATSIFNYGLLGVLLLLLGLFLVRRKKA